VVTSRRAGRSGGWVRAGRVEAELHVEESSPALGHSGTHGDVDVVGRTEEPPLQGGGEDHLRGPVEHPWRTKDHDVT
jgi:hypothetical protein